MKREAVQFKALSNLLNTTQVFYLQRTIQDLNFNQSPDFLSLTRHIVSSIN